VLDERGVAFNPFDGILYDVSGGCCIQRRWKYGNVVKIPSSVVSGNQSGPLLLLRHSHDQTYYHFSIEVMTRLVRTPRYIRTALALGEIEINAPNTKFFQRSYLDMLLCPPERPSCLRYRTEIAGSLHSMILFPPEYSYKQDNSQSIMKLQMEYKSKFEVKCCPSKPTFVVLERESTRVVKNLKPFISMLQESYPDIDFPIVKETELERMNLSGYANVFSHAHGMISGHGAGLANMVWLDSTHNPINRNITVVQMIRDGQGGNVYGHLSRILGYKYVEIRCLQAPGADHNHYAPTVIEDLCAAKQMVHPVFESLSRHENTSLCPLKV
jgi:Glycosyltransferase 61